MVGRLAGRQVDNRCWIVGAVQAGAHESPPCERFQLLTSTDDDDVLLERLRAGDEKAFDELVARYDGALRRVARTFVRTSAAADDVAQETWLAAVRGLKDFEGRSSLRTWLFRILVNRARTRAKREARSVPFSVRTTLLSPDKAAARSIGVSCSQSSIRLAWPKPVCAPHLRFASAASCASI